MEIIAINTGHFSHHIAFRFSFPVSVPFSLIPFSIGMTLD